MADELPRPLTDRADWLAPADRVRPGALRFSNAAVAAAIGVAISLSLLDLAWNRSVAVAAILFLTAVVSLRVGQVRRQPSEGIWADLERGLFPFAFSLRGGVLIAAYALKQSQGLVTYNVDVKNYVFWAHQISAYLPFQLLDVRPYDLAGTYDIGFHYFLGLVFWLFRENHLAAQVLMVLAGSASAYLLYRIATPFLGRYAVIPGLILAVAPNSIYLSSVDLVKDTLLTFAFLLALRSGQLILTRANVAPGAVLALACGFVLARLIRVYVGVLLDCGLVGFPILQLILSGRLKRPGRGVALVRIGVIAATFLVAEGGLRVAGEPFAAVEMLAMKGWLPSARMAFSGPRGRLERLFRRGPALGSKGFEEEVEEEDPTKAAPVSLTHYGFDLLRRIYGPFLWTPPTRDHFFQFFIGNWPAYLEVGLWYVVFPFGLCGLIPLARSQRWDGWLIAAVVAMFFALLFGFHVTHRQRTSNLLPLMAVAATAGWLWATPRIRKTVLALQGTAVVLLAAAYWTAALLLRR